MNVLEIYKKLFKYFGPQGWWPIFDKKSKKCTYNNYSDRYSYCNHKNAFEVCVGAILTQNTAWKNVEKSLCNLTTFSHSQECENVRPELLLSCKNLEALVRPAGYYNQKAKKLRIFAEWWQKMLTTKSKRPLTFCSNKKITGARKELLELWGIGPETADSMLLYAFNKPIFVIDAYTKRLCKECGVEFKTYDEYRKFFESRLPKNAKLFNEYHALIVAWGKLHAKNKEEAKEILYTEKN